MDKQKNISIVLILILSSLAFSACGVSKWTGFYYPFGTGGETIYSSVDQFNNYEGCLDWADAQSEIYNRPESEDWECGSNCRLSESSKHLKKNDPKSFKELGPMYICDETK